MLFLRMKFDLIALERLTEYQELLQIQLREQRQAVTYLMGYASGLGFGTVIWGQGKLVSESGGFTP